MSEQEEIYPKSNRDEEEERHWYDVARTLLHYDEFVSNELMRRQRHLNKLSDRHASYLPESSFDKIGALAHASRGNQDFFEDCVIHYGENMQKPDESGQRKELPKKNDGDPINYNQQHRNEAVLHSIHREWTSDGKEERDAIFTPILAALQKHLPILSSDMAYRQRVLMPGCGLARLPVEVAALGYSAEGNEFSAFMLMASNFIMNGITEPRQYTIYPFIDKISNIYSIADTLEGHSFPDNTAMNMLTNSEHFHLFEAFMSSASEQVDPVCLECCTPTSTQEQWQALPRYPPLGMSTGDFVKIYGPTSAPGDYDCIITCFFIDTAPNVIDYIDTIEHLLRPGGVWINLGPLLYHWMEDNEGNGDKRYDESIELSYEELKHVISGMGMDIVEESRVGCTYTRARKSLMHTVYDAVFFVARKKRSRRARYEVTRDDVRGRVGV